MNDGHFIDNESYKAPECMKPETVEEVGNQPTITERDVIDNWSNKAIYPVDSNKSSN